MRITPAVSPQTSRSTTGSTASSRQGIAQKKRSCSCQTIDRFSCTASDMRNPSGTSNASATSSGLIVISASAGTMPTTGATLNPVRDT